MLRTSFGRLGFPLAVALLGLTGCRALLDGDDLDLHGGQGGGGGGPSTGTDGSTSSGGGGGDGPTTATSTGPGGGATSSTSTTSTGTTSSTTTSTGTGGATCGNGILEGGEECDDDGPNCGDGCTFVGGFTCADAIDVGVKHEETVVVATTTIGGASDPRSCQFFTGPSRFFRVTPAGDGFLTAWITGAGTSFLSSLSARTACDASLLCTDSAAPTGGEVVSVRVTGGVPVWIQVASRGAGAEGEFTMELTLDRGTCSDPVQIPLEPGSGASVFADLAGQGNETQSSCGGTEEDVIYRVTPVGAQGGSVLLLPNGGFDGVLYSRPTCGTAQGEVCVNDAGAGGVETLDELDLDAPIHVIVDADSAGGVFTMTFGSF